MPAIDCGIDIGSTNLKTVFAGEDGRTVFAKSIASPRSFDEFGPLTDAMALVKTLEGMIIEGWRELGSGAPLRSITAAGVGEDGVGISDAFQPTGYALPWFDRRAAAEVQKLQQHSRFSERAGIGISTERTAAKWLWLSRHRPHELANARCWIALTDFPAVWWSGRPFMSCSLVPRTGCYDVYARRWIEELLAASHAPALPPILKAGEIVGGVRKGRLRDSGAASDETVLVAGGHDHPVAASMIRRFDPFARVDSLGTANLVYGETTRICEPHVNDHIAFSIPASGNAGLSCLGVVEFGAAMASLQRDENHLRNHLGVDRLPGSPPSSLEELKCTANHDDRSIRRGLEVAGLKSRRMLDAMHVAGVARHDIYATGGWSRSRALVELRASIFGEPIKVVGDMELVALGAALFGMEAATGKSVCPIAGSDIVKIEPAAAWQTEYQEIYEEIKPS